MNKQSDDKLAWWEKLPLALATVAQSVVVGFWYYRYIDLGHWVLNVAIAVVAGLALDAIVVTTIMGRRVGRDSAWSMGASLGAFFCSALIAVDSYSDWLSTFRPLLHVSYPAMVFLYSQHLATARQSQRQALPVPQAPALEVATTSNGHAPQEATATRALDDLVTTVAPQAVFTCPHCGAALASKQALGAAVRNKHCPACK
jgi:hypothetical protein